MIRDTLKPATNFIRSVIGTNGVAEQMARVDAKIDALAQRLPGLDQLHAPPPSQPLPPAAPAIDVSMLLHQSRGAMMRDMPRGAKRLLSAGCAGKWYFDWIEQTYGPVPEHLGIEFYSPKPEGLPDYVTWIANTAGNMVGVQSASCDLVISGQNIEHLWPDEVAGFMIEAARVLRPGGTLCVDSPNRTITAPLVWSHPEHTVELTAPEMRRLFELAGFEVTKEAGLWLCQDDHTGRMLPFDANTPDSDWSVAERLISARDKPEQSFLWWLEGRRTNQEPDRKAIFAATAEIFDRAWPERTQRLLVPPGRTTEQRADGEWVIAAPGAGGVVFYGPYMPLRPGHYRVTFELIEDVGATGAYAQVDIMTGAETILAQQVVSAGSNQVTLEVDLRELTFGFQFRCTSLGKAGFVARRHVGLVETPAMPLLHAGIPT
jgi:SAM-dependent methyltransferase